MQVEIDIKFEQLIDIARKLPMAQWNKLKQEVEKEVEPDTKAQDMEAFLLSAPTFTKKQIDTIAKTRNAINQWRTK